MALARALAVEPKVLLLDEPFGALDATVRKELREWLRRLHDEVHVTTIFVTHDQEEAMDVAEQIVVMKDGHVEHSHLRENGAEEALIERIVHLGFEVRVELVLADGDHLWAQLTRSQAEELEISQGQIMYARPSRARV